MAGGRAGGNGSRAKALRAAGGSVFRRERSHRIESPASIAPRPNLHAVPSAQKLGGDGDAQHTLGFRLLHDFNFEADFVPGGTKPILDRCEVPEAKPFELGGLHVVVRDVTPHSARVALQAGRGELPRSLFGGLVEQSQYNRHGQGQHHGQQDRAAGQLQAAHPRLPGMQVALEPGGVRGMIAHRGAGQLVRLLFAV